MCSLLSVKLNGDAMMDLEKIGISSKRYIVLSHSIASMTPGSTTSEIRVIEEWNESMQIKGISARYSTQTAGR